MSLCDFAIMAMTGLVAYDTDVPVLHRRLCSALVYVSMNETAAAAGLSVAAAVSVLSDVLGVSGATISEVSLLQLSNLLAFTLSPSTLAPPTLGRSFKLSDGEIAGSIGGQSWSLDVRVERRRGERHHRWCVTM